MLIQITNKCHMGCPHCLQDSTPCGRHMTGETFDKVLEFARESMPLVVSITGGEPTEHPQWCRFAKELLSLKSALFVTLLTNGSWIEDDDTRKEMAGLVRRSAGRLVVQVYSHPSYYKRHEWTVERAARFRSIGIRPDFKSPIVMQDLGRARKNCIAETENSDHVPSCINSHLLAMQTRSMQQFMMAAAQAGKFCRPLIDPDGNIHMSESWLCPTVASVHDGVGAAFEKMRRSRPCEGCRLYRNFAELHAEEMSILK